jgi:hypothetical protein
MAEAEKGEISKKRIEKGGCNCSSFLPRKNKGRSCWLFEDIATELICPKEEIEHVLLVDLLSDEERMLLASTL